jgi:hypothetical protein
MDGGLVPYQDPPGSWRVVLGVLSLAVVGAVAVLTLREVAGRHVERGGAEPAPPPASELERAPVLDIEIDDAEAGALRSSSGDGVEAGSPQSFVWRTWTSERRSSTDLLVDAARSARDRGAELHRLACRLSGSVSVLGTQSLDDGLTVTVEISAVEPSAGTGEIRLRVSAGSSPTVAAATPGGGMEVDDNCPADVVEGVGA